MGRKRSTVREDVIDEGDGQWSCPHCYKKVSGSISRAKEHLLGYGSNIQWCREISAEDRDKLWTKYGNTNKKVKIERDPPQAFLSCKDLPKTCIPSMHDKELVAKTLVKWLISNNMPFDLVNQLLFKDLVRSVAGHGSHYKPPSSSELWKRWFPEVKMDVENYVKDVKESWQITAGCTIMFDEFQNFIFIIVYSTKGPIFLKSFEISNDDDVNDKFVCSSIEDVGVDHVVQLVTNSDVISSSIKRVLERNEMYSKIYQIPCAAHGIHSLLKAIYDEVEWVRKIIDDSRDIVYYMMYENETIVSLVRQYINNGELKYPNDLKFASNYQMLQSILSNKKELQRLVTSEEWRNLHNYDGNQRGKNIASIVKRTEFWCHGEEIIKIMEPLVGVLSLVEHGGFTSGYLYQAMEKAKGEIQCRCSFNEAMLGNIMELVKQRSKDIIHPIHVLAAHLNPAYLCGENCQKDDAGIEEGMRFVLENGVIDEEEKEIFTQQLRQYLEDPRKNSPTVFDATAKQMLKDIHPSLWWHHGASSVEVLKKYARRILSQPCKSSCNLLKYNAFEDAQRNKINMATHELRNSTLVRLRMNILIMEKYGTMDAKYKEPIDVENCRELPDYVYHGQVWTGDQMKMIDENSNGNATKEIDHFGSKGKDANAEEEFNSKIKFIESLTTQFQDVNAKEDIKGLMAYVKSLNDRVKWMQKITRSSSSKPNPTEAAENQPLELDARLCKMLFAKQPMKDLGNLTLSGNDNCMHSKEAIGDQKSYQVDEKEATPNQQTYHQDKTLESFSQGLSNNACGLTEAAPNDEQISNQGIVSDNFFNRLTNNSGGLTEPREEALSNYHSSNFAPSNMEFIDEIGDRLLLPLDMAYHDWMTDMEGLILSPTQRK